MAALIALYGDKPTRLAQLISDCQTQIASVVGSAFHPYDIRQVHATIVGMGQVKASTLINACFYEYRGQEIQMDFGSLLNFLRHGGRLPFQVQIGGFQKRDYPFLSRGTRPYERSFGLEYGRAVIIGWPIRGTPITNFKSTALDLIHESRNYPNTLDEIRQAVQAYGFLHRYYRRLGDIDNDFYFRIGLYDLASLPDKMQNAVEYKIRQFLGDIEPVIVEIAASDICIAFSDHETLPINSTRVLRVSDPNVSANSIEYSYSQRNPKGE